MDTKRLLMFLVLCIGLRTALAYTAYTLDPQYLPYLGYVTLLPAFGFFIIYFFNLRETGMEVSGEKIWWNHLRPVHGFLYLAFSVAAIQRKSYSWIFLFVDVVIGLISFLDHHYK